MKQIKVISINQQNALMERFPLFSCFYPYHEFSIQLETDGYIALLESIIAQQLSAKVATTLIKRFKEATKFDVDFLANQSIEQIKQLGTTTNKAKAIRKLSQLMLDQPTYFDQLTHLTHDQIIQKLIQLHQVGPWTAEMFMIFSMNRPDVLSLTDLVIKKGLSHCWNHPYDHQKALDLKQQLNQDATLASLMLWEKMENLNPL